MNARYKEVEIIYFVQSVRISKSIDLETNKQVCVKKIVVSDFEDLSYLFKEIIALFTLNQKTYFVKILDYWLDGQGIEVTYLNIVTEYFDRGDLSKEILERGKTAKPFTLEALKSHFKQLLAGFKELQEMNFSHRDIKAENIFIDINEQLVIGDLGSAAQKCEQEMTLIGSHIYMSPEIRSGFDEFNRGEKGPRVNYNPFKSDVWSLGITFLYMITLEKPTSLTNLSILKDRINVELNKVQNELFKNLLRKMLRVNPDDRDDFNTLYNWFVNEIDFNGESIIRRNSLMGSQKLNRGSNGILNESFNPFSDESVVCSVCCLKDDMIKCTKCNFSAHFNCMDNNFSVCTKCKGDLDFKNSMFNCKNCNNRFSGDAINTECKHLICIDCQGTQSNCHLCLGFSLNSKKPESFSKLPNLFCPDCKTSMILKGKTLVCPNHKDYKICIVCKTLDHKGSCLSANSSNTIYCLKCGAYTERQPNSFIIFCNHCHNNYCYICLKGTNEDSHIKCSNMFTWE